MEMTSSLAGRGAARWGRYATLLRRGIRSFSSSSGGLRTNAALEPPNLRHLAETSRISLSPEEVEQFTPKIRQVVDWFGQLQSVDLGSVDPALRVDTVAGGNLRDDVPESFENRPAILAAVPSSEDPYIKVPKVLNKE
ncbi:glutamyl-tRNA(Gln) amidotransferase subunit C [Wolffia australiana]